MPNEINFSIFQFLVKIHVPFSEFHLRSLSVWTIILRSCLTHYFSTSHLVVRPSDSILQKLFNIFIWTDMCIPASTSRWYCFPPTTFYNNPFWFSMHPHPILQSWQDIGSMKSESGNSPSHRFNFYPHLNVYRPKFSMHVLHLQSLHLLFFHTSPCLVRLPKFLRAIQNPSFITSPHFSSFSHLFVTIAPSTSCHYSSRARPRSSGDSLSHILRSPINH
jgi:hypothetical protein